MEAELEHLKDHFVYRGEQVHLYCHMYNLTYFNERCVELALAKRFLKGRPRPNYALELGNVLAHYENLDALAPRRTVVDLYERHKRVDANMDLFQWAEMAKGYFDSIVAISTIEHIGVDDDTDDPSRAVAAIEALRSLLNPDGRLFVSFPAGHNAALDAALAGDGPLDEALTQVLYHRVDWGVWVEVERGPDYVPPGYGVTQPWAEAVWIGEFGPLVTSS
jgi:hypothetical protein